MRVDPLTFEQQRLASSTFVHEADLVVDVSCAGIEVVDLKLHTVEALVIEGVAHRETRRLSSQALVSYFGHPDAELARPVVEIEPVEY